MANSDMSVVRENGAWHLDKRVQLADLIALLMLAVAGAAWIFAVQSRVTINETNIGNIRDYDAAIQAEFHRELEGLKDNIRDNQLDIIRRLERIEDQVTVHRSQSEHD